MQNINYAFLLSRPVWGAWIEIGNIVINSNKQVKVAPRMGRVD